MYLHLGRDTLVLKKNVLCVIDMDTGTLSRHTRAFLDTAQRENRVTVVAEDLPKSAVVCLEDGVQNVYICQVAASTLRKRWSENGLSNL